MIIRGYFCHFLLHISHFFVSSMKVYPMSLIKFMILHFQILRAILHKKIYPQNPTTQKVPTRKFLDKTCPKSCNNLHSPATRKCLDNKCDEYETDSDEETMDNSSEEGSKWVKTDSECKFSASQCIKVIHI